MKKYQYSVLLTLLSFFLITYWLFIKPTSDSRKKSIYGEVVSILELKRDAGYKINVSENNKTRIVYYSLTDIKIGDTLIKDSNSEVLYIKSKDDSVLRIAEGKNYTIFK